MVVSENFLSRMTCFRGATRVPGAPLAIGIRVLLKLRKLLEFSFSMPDQTKNDAASNKVFPHVLAGISSGIVASLFTCPLDVVKTQKQSGVVLADSASQSTAAFLQRIWQREGLRGLYRGLSPALLAYIPTFGIYFPAYHFFKGFYGRRLFEELASTNRQQTASPMVHILASTSAGAFSTTLTNPLWLIRTRMMIQSRDSTPFFYTSTWNGLRGLWEEGGVRALGKGLAPAAFGLLHTIIYFPIYEHLKTVFSQRQQQQSGNDSYLGAPWILLASMSAKLIATIGAYPHEVLRTHIQKHDTRHRLSCGRGVGIVSGCRDIYARRGIGGFYRGLPTSLIRAVPATGIIFVTFEKVLQLFSAQN